MKWLLGGLVLFAVGVLLRRFLRLGGAGTSGPGRLLALNEERQVIYQPVVLELETQAAILGISLNDAIAERDAGKRDIAWRLVRLSASEWDRLAEILAALLNVMAKYLPRLAAIHSMRSVVPQRFKSRRMMDYVRTHELLDRLVFRSKPRYQLHLRVLRGAAETLTAEFRRMYRYADRTGDITPEFWSQLDLYFHDFDLVTKESLLAFRVFLSSLPHSHLADFSLELRVVLRRGVRATAVRADP